MKYLTDCKYEEETHDWGHYIPQNAIQLFLGTFPTKKAERRFEFFYSSARNRFWGVISGLTGIPCQHYSGKPAVEERKRLLDRLKLGVTDIGHRVYRQKESSLDHHLFPIEFNDIFGLLDNHPAIDTLIVSSSSGGNSVLSWFAGYCDLNHIQFDTKGKAIPRRTQIILGERRINIVITYSTSSTFRKMNLEELTEHYREVLRLGVE
jgi:G:T/U-mismatch repair DNA glycosylase